LIRQELLRGWGPAKFFEDNTKVAKLCKERVMRVQFHPGYGYEEFVRGLQLGEGGKTEYRDGVLLEIIQKMENESKSDADIPFVLILDEMNRADLSKVLGECFSLLENRQMPMRLAGYEEREIIFPDNLYIIGTMNLIDQSLEQVDFALRRRFLWFPRDFSRDEFLSVCEYRWNDLLQGGVVAKKWSFEYLSDEFQMLADRATEVNTLISQFHALGKQFEIGHTYFADVVDFMKLNVMTRKQKGVVLFTRKGTWKEPVQQLWTHSLRPLLDQYLTGIESNEKSSFVGRIQSILETGK
jgi:5-methylcytosine-specific restriction protein B